MFPTVRPFALAALVYLGIASLYLPSPAATRRPPPARTAPRPEPPQLTPAAPRERLMASSCKTDDDCKTGESCVDGTCCMPAEKTWHPPQTAVASWGDSLRIAR